MKGQKWARFILYERHKFSSPTHKAPASNPMLQLRTFGFFATYCNPWLRVRSACSVLEETAAYVWVFTTLSLLKESPNPSSPRDTELLFSKVCRCFMMSCREVPLFDLHLGLRLSPPFWDLGVQVCCLSRGRGCGNGCPVLNDRMVSCRSPPRRLSESSAYLTPCICEVRLLACPEYLSLWAELPRFSSDTLFFQPAEPEDFDIRAGSLDAPDCQTNATVDSGTT